ncbi:MAG: glycosyltransferase [Nitrospinota bacterium]|nr:glycosyltransferase [Nitrospinota bacterium]
MRVLMVSHACAEPINRGKLKALTRRPGLEISLLVPRLWKERERTLTTDPGDGEGFPLYAGAVLFPGRVTGHVYRSGLMQAIKSARPDIIHLEEEPWSLAAAQLLALLPWYRPRPRLVLFSFENMDLDLPFFRRCIERKSLAVAEEIIAGGETVRDRLLLRGASPGRITVIPQFGLDADLFHPPEEGDRSDEFTVGFIGRHVHEKGIDTLIRALVDLKGNWRAIIVGDGPRRAEMEALARSLNLSGRIEFPGWVDHFEIPGLLRKMDVLVLPTRSVERWKEQFGHVLIEAMSSGVVPVGSTSGEIPNVIGKEGFVFPENDSLSLANILAELQENPELRRRISISARERARTEFGWEVIAEKTHAVYERAFAAKSAGAGRAAP